MFKVENTEICFHENWSAIDVNLAMAILNLGRSSSQFNLLVETACQYLIDKIT